MTSALTSSPSASAIEAAIGVALVTGGKVASIAEITTPLTFLDVAQTVLREALFVAQLDWLHGATYRTYQRSGVAHPFMFHYIRSPGTSASVLWGPKNFSSHELVRNLWHHAATPRMESSVKFAESAKKAVSMQHTGAQARLPVSLSARANRRRATEICRVRKKVAIVKLRGKLKNCR